MGENIFPKLYSWLPELDIICFPSLRSNTSLEKEINAIIFLGLIFLLKAQLATFCLISNLISRAPAFKNPIWARDTEQLISLSKTICRYEVMQKTV